MELNYYTAPFKNTKFDMRDAYSSEEIQKAMFKMGFRFFGTATGEDRKLLSGNFKSFYIDENLRILGSIHTVGSGIGYGRTDYKKVTPLEILEASKLFLRLKGIKHRARKMRKAIDRRNERLAAEDAAEVQVTVSLDTMLSNIVRDAGGVEVDKDGWIVWNGGDCPVARGTLVDIKYRDKGVRMAVPALKIAMGGRGAEARFWANDNHQSDIVAYRIATMKIGSLSSLGSTGTLVTSGSVTAQNISFAPSTFASRSDAMCNDAPDTNPKKQYGLASVPLNMWSSLASAYGSLALYNGSLKYGKANFANTKVEASIYIAAAQRHLAAWAAGEEFDPADGVPNLGGVLANIAILLESRAAGNLIDDRLVMPGYLKERDALKAIVKSLTALHADKNPKHYTMENASE